MKSKELRSLHAPLGFQNIHLHFNLETDASEEQLTKLIQLTERSCVVDQTLQHSPEIDITRAALPIS